MLTLLLWLLVDPQPPSIQPLPPPVSEARLADGSSVRLTLRTPSLSIQTTYGLLTVPVAAIRKIDFGLHAPAGIPERVQQAVQRLGSTAHRERTAAVAELVSLGEYAYPAVQAATKATDLEVAERAQQVVARLRETISPDRLRTDPRDRLDTAEFTILGRLVAPALDVRTRHFGAVQLPLCDLRQLVALSVTSGRVTVDAATHTPTAWLNTGIDISPGRPVVLTATGQVDLWPATPGQYTCGPTGSANAGTVPGLPGRPGALLGRLGDTGAAFVVGDRAEIGQVAGGRLFLAVVPSGWNNASAGTYEVRIGER